MVNNAKDHKDLCFIVDEIDRMFMADVPEIEMQDEDWQTFNRVLYAHEFINA